MKHLTKSFSISMLFMLAAILILPGCKKEEEENGIKELVGTWVYTEQMSYLTKEYKYVFKSDYTYTWSALGVEMDKGKFTLEGDVITCRPDNSSYAPSVLEFYANGSVPHIYDPELDIEYTKR